MNWKLFGICALPLLLVSLLTIASPFFSSDEYGYLVAAKSMAHGGIADGDAARFPFYPFALSLVYRLFGYSAIAAQVFSLVLSLATLALLFWFVEKLFNEQTAFLATLFLAVNPLFAYLSTRTLTEPLFVLLLLCVAVFTYLSKDNLQLTLAAGAAASLLFLTRYVGIYAIGAMFLFLLFYRRNELLSPIKLAVFAFGFIVPLVPWMVLSFQQTGSPLGLLLSFFNQQLALNEAVFTLPDRIPTYFVALPFVLGFVGISLLAGLAREEEWKNILAKLKQEKLALAGLFALVAFVTMEVYGWLNVALLRYLLPVVPFLAIISASFIQPIYQDKQLWKKLTNLFIMFNLLIAVLVIAFFASYSKYIGYREAPQWASSHGCTSINSNIQKVVEHYTGLKNTVASPKCFVVSGYDGKLPVPVGYRDVFDSHGVKVYKKIS